MTESNSPAETIAFLGLGVMGKPMAINLCTAGYDVVAYSRTPASVAAAVGRGARGAASIAEACRDADIVITMLPDSPEVFDVVLGPGGVLDSARPGSTLIDMSTIRPDAAQRVAHATAAMEIRFLDAPVSGGEQGAVDGTLSIMVGGDADILAAVAPVLSVLGKTIVHVGPVGSGQTVKAANQLIVAGNIELVAEALVFLEARGVDTDAAISVLEGGLAGSTVLTRKARSMIRREFEPGFRIDLHHKDLGIFTASAREAGTATPLGALLAQLMAIARAQGDGGLDHSALFRLVRRLSDPVLPEDRR